MKHQTAEKNAKWARLNVSLMTKDKQLLLLEALVEAHPADAEIALRAFKDKFGIEPHI